LLAEAEFGSGGVGAKAFAFPFDDHGKLAGDLVVLADIEATGRAAELLGSRIEKHGNLRVSGVD